MAGTEKSSDGISRETRLMAARVRERAASLPTPERLAAMAAEALRTPGRDMSAEEIAALADRAIAQAQQVSYYLARLAVLLGEGEQDGGP